MKNQKNTAILVILLLWAGLLCVSGYLRAEQVTLDTGSYSLGRSAEQLTAEEQAFPIALSEPTAPHRATNPPDSVLPLLLPVGVTQAFLVEQLNVKPFKTGLSFSSLTEQFRIQPNAP